MIKALLGKSAVPDDSPYTTGCIGLLDTKPSETAMNACDTLLIAGSSMPYIEYYPKPGKARRVQIDLDPARIGLRYPAEVGLVGNTAKTLDALLPLIKRKQDRSFLAEAQAGKRDWDILMETRGTSDKLTHAAPSAGLELAKRLPANALVASDFGTNTSLWARCIPSTRGQMHLCSGTLASMACGFPYAIAAQLAYPDRPVIASVGGGGFSMLMAEMATCVKYNLPLKVVIVRNNSLGQIKWEQMVFLGNPEFACALQPIDFAAFTRACGAEGFTVTDPKQCGPVFDRMLNAEGPAIVKVVVDTHAPPLPAMIKPGQALHSRKLWPEAQKTRRRL